MAECRYLICGVAVATYGTGAGGVAFCRTGGSGNYRGVGVTERSNLLGLGEICVTNVTVDEVGLAGLGASRSLSENLDCVMTESFAFNGAAFTGLGLGAGCIAEHVNVFFGNEIAEDVFCKAIDHITRRERQKGYCEREHYKCQEFDFSHFVSFLIVYLVFANRTNYSTKLALSQ